MADVFELCAKLTLDKSEYEKNLDDAEDNGKKKSSKIGSVLKTIGKATAAALATASAAVVSLVKQSVSAYSEYEQLVGGVETLFGTNGQTLEEYAASVGQTVEEASAAYNALEQAQEDVLANASNAWQTAGMSANDYMENVTSFAASLVSSLDGDTVAAASLADTAITDMSDNANKMGTDIDSIESAYQGFAKSNYTMLDNLKLGYAGSKEGMEQLLADASAISGIDYDISSYADIVSAIHVIQEDMGIAGTTAEEASSTIQGSMSAMSAAWTNLLTGMSDSDADMGSLIDNLVSSVSTFGSNILPVIQTALSGVGTLLQTLLPEILDAALPTLMDMLPDLISTVTDMILELIDAIVDNLPTILDAIMQAIEEILVGLADMMPDLVDSLVECIMSLIDALTENIDTILTAILEIVLAVIQGLLEHLPEITEALFQLIWAIVEWLVTEGIPMIAETFWTLFNEFMEWKTEMWNNILEWLSGVWASLSEWFSGLLADLGTWASGIWESISGWFTDLVSDVAGWGSDIWQTITDAFADVWDIGNNIVSGIWEGISDGYDWITEQISGWVDNVIQWFKTLFKIASPSKVFRDQIGKNLALGIGVGFDTNIDDVKRDMANALDVDSMAQTLGLDDNVISFADVTSGLSASALPVSDFTTAGDSNSLNDVYALLSQYMPQVASGMSQSIVLDTGALVGQTASAYNSALGNLVRQRAYV